MSPAHSILAPLSKLFGLGVTVRNAAYDRGIFSAYRSSLPVISIGNIAVGGSGKTPTVLALATELASRGARPVILSRGYGGSQNGPHIVTDVDTADAVGDEPKMMAKYFPVVIAKDRARGAQLIEQQSLGSIILLDDGFQHRALARDVDIVCVNERHADDIASGALLPTGHLRERWTSVEARADIIIYIGEHSPARIPATSLPIFRARREFQGIFSDAGVELSAQPVVAFAGIAHPESFFELLARNGFPVQQGIPLGDHAVIARKFIQGLRDRSPNIPVVCTEKDFARMDQSLRHELFFCKTTLVIVGIEECVHLIERSIPQASLTP